MMYRFHDFLDALDFTDTLWYGGQLMFDYEVIEAEEVPEAVVEMDHARRS